MGSFILFTGRFHSQINRCQKCRRTCRHYRCCYLSTNCRCSQSVFCVVSQTETPRLELYINNNWSFVITECDDLILTCEIAGYFHTFFIHTLGNRKWRRLFIENQNKIFIFLSQNVHFKTIIEAEPKDCRTSH